MRRSASCASKQEMVNLQGLPIKAYDESDFQHSLLSLRVDSFRDPAENRNNVTNVSKEVVRRILDEDHYITMVCAPPQFGKTSIIKDTIFQLVSSKVFHIQNIFNITGLSDRHWLEQMRQRMYPSIHPHIYHNANIKQHANEIVQTILRGGKTLIVIDEAHYASGSLHTCPRTLFSISQKLLEATKSKDLTLSKPNADHQVGETFEGHDVRQDENEPEPWFIKMHQILYHHGVRILCISATPDAVKENLVRMSACSLRASVITVDASVYPQYTGFETYVRRGRVFQTQKFDHVESTNKRFPSPANDARPFLQKVVDLIKSMPKPRYHLLRLNDHDYKSRNKLGLTLEGELIPYVFRYLDCKSKDFKTIELEKEPSMHTFVFLKDMLRVAKSISIRHVGVLIERPVKYSNDSTISQSLIGRCCGWDKAPYVDQITIFTHIKSVLKYIELCKNGFEYDQVRGLKGYGLKTTQQTIRTTDCLTGNAIERELVVVSELEDSDIVGLKKKLQTCLEKRLHVYHMMVKLIQNDNQPLTWNHLREGRNLSTTCYTKWALRGNHYKVLVSVRGSGYRIRDDILQEFGPMIRAMMQQDTHRNGSTRIDQGVYEDLESITIV